MRYALLFLLLLASVLEYSAQGRFGVAMVTGLYFFLLLQAEHAAKRYLKYGLIFPVPMNSGVASGAGKRKITVEDVIDLPRLGGRRSYDRKAEQPKAEKKAAPRFQA